MNTIDFDSIITKQGELYGKSLSIVLSEFAKFQPSKVVTGPIERKLTIQADYIASIPFVGTVTGEFIVAMKKEDAKTIFPDAENSEDIEALLTESLNMVAGSCLKNLSIDFQKLTMTPPRVVSGSARYPNLKNVSLQLLGKNGTISAYFYIDRMRLDLAESYKKVISDLSEINEELNNANQKLMDQQTHLIHSEKMASLGMMAAGVAHEINNPLAFVVSNTDVLNSYIEAMRSLLIGYDQLLLLLGSGKSELAKAEFAKIKDIKEKEDLSFILEDTKKLLTESKFGLDRIRGIVNGLKRFSRIDDAGIKQVQINEELQNTLMLLQNELKYKCTVETDFQAKKQIECMPGELSQVFLNLIVNAAQAVNKENGVIKISTADTEQMLEIKVKDNGKGISEENISKIFSPFFTTKPVGEGTGLGLAISHGIIQKHGGKISVASKLNEGTEFTILLPYTAVSAVA